VSLVALDTDVASFSLRNRLPDQLRVAAEKWGQLQARAQRRGRPRPQNDTWIAACCLVDDLPLATLNIKDFADFAEHEGLTLIGGQEP
jgi:predicted nucleic acid-binding protein